MNTNPETRRILAFGDSNTWGRIPGDDNNARYLANVRWTGRLQALLGTSFEVIEEGLNGRTTNFDSPNKAGKNGRAYLFACLETHKPLDLIILALGTNDLKAKYGLTAGQVGEGLHACVKAILAEGRNRSGKVPAVIILSPVVVIEKQRLRFGKPEIDFLGALEKSKALAGIYQGIAAENGFGFVDLAQIAVASEVDGVHLEAEEHNKIAECLCPMVKSMLKAAD